VHAFDDRADVLAAYRSRFGLDESQVTLVSIAEPSTTTLNAADLLNAAAMTYRERNAVYGDNFRMVGPIMRILFPQGVAADTLGHDAFHLFELVIVKLSRLAVSGLTHTDSARDAAVYCAMIEAAIEEKGKLS
jgi:hypothetical protein